MVETAGHHESREGAQPGKTALAFIFMQAGMLEAGRGVPSDRHAAKFAVGDIEGAVDEHGEAQSRSAAEFQHADAALDAVFERHQAHAGKLRKRPGPGGGVAARPWGARAPGGRGPPGAGRPRRKVTA